MCLKKNGIVLGCGRLERDKIWTVYIDPKFQRKDIGTAIMNKLENFAKKKRYKKSKFRSLKTS